MHTPKPKFLQLCPFAVLVAVIFASQTQAAEIMGTVRSATAEYATVESNSHSMPRPADKAQIFFKIAGLDDEISVGEGYVYEITGTNIMVKIEKATGTVKQGQLVRFITNTTSGTTLPQSASPSPKKEPEKTIAQRSEVEMMASTVVTFDELAPGPFAGDAFAKHGLRFVPAKGVPGIYKAEPNMILPSPCTNVMLLGGERVTSFAIILDPPVKRLALYRIGAAKGASMPTWKMMAFNKAGKLVGSTGETHGLPKEPRYFGIDGDNITRVEIATDNRQGAGTWATWSSLPIAGFGFDR